MSNIISFEAGFTPSSFFAAAAAVVLIVVHCCYDRPCVNSSIVMKQEQCCCHSGTAEICPCERGPIGTAAKIITGVTLLIQ